MKSFSFYLFLVFFAVIVSVPLIIPYLHSGYFPTHDGEWAVVRLSDMFRLLRDFQIPARFSENLNSGYGYPLFNFAYPFPYYLGVLIHLLGFGFVDTIKILFILTLPISAFFMFLTSKKIWGNNLAGIISAFLYLYFPYRIVDLFVRGSIGESFGFAIFPIILFSLASLIKKPESTLYKVLGGVSFGILILSHNIMATLFMMSLGIFFLANLEQRKKLFKNYIYIFTIGFGLSAFFWIPALLEKSNILLSQIPIADRNLYYVSFYKLVNSNWGYGVPTDRINPFTYQIGWPFLVALLSTIVIVIYKLIKKNKILNDERLVITFIVGVIFFILMMFKEFSVIWRLPILSEINYPWTLLSQVGLLISLLAGYLSKFKFAKYVGYFLIILSLALFLPVAKPFTYFDKGDGFYFTNQATTTSSNELMPVWVKKHPSERPNSKVEYVKGEGEIKNLLYNSKSTSFSIENKTDSIIRINTIYYPGWKITVNGIEKEIKYDNEKGLMQFDLPKGNFQISAKFTETPLRLLSDTISIVTLIFVFLFIIKAKWKF